LRFVNIIICWGTFYYWNINLGHPLRMAIDFNTYSNQILTHGKTWEFFIYDFISYIMRKNQHGPISIIYMIRLEQRKIWHMALGINLNDFIFYWNLDLKHPLWLFNLGVFILWHVTQSNVTTWHIDWILG
jgi:hypothetical protein